MGGKFKQSESRCQRIDRNRSHVRGLVNYIEKENDTFYGSLLCEGVELVRYTFNNGSISMDTIETFEF